MPEPKPTQRDPRPAQRDPRRGLELLWSGVARTGRSAGPGLNVESIVAAAIAVADAEGIDAVSMRRVAEELGGGTMSLYRHVPGKAELLDLMYDRAIGEGLRAPPDPGTGWREQLLAIARSSFGDYQRHPWLLRVPSNRPPLGPNVLDSYEQLLRVVDGIGLTGPEMQGAVDLVAGHIAATARRAIEAAQIERESGESDERWWETRQSFWSEQFDADRFPVISRLYDEGAYGQPVDVLEFGIERICDGLQALIDRRA